MNRGITARSAGQSPAFAGAVEAGGLVFTSGLVCPDLLRGQQRDAPGQIAGVLDVLNRTLARHRCGLGDVVALTVYLRSPDILEAWNDAFSAAFPAAAPARTTVVADFVLPGACIEISAVAATPGTGPGTPSSTADARM